MLSMKTPLTIFELSSSTAVLAAGGFGLEEARNRRGLTYSTGALAPSVFATSAHAGSSLELTTSKCKEKLYKDSWLRGGRLC
jgi:hypothetical protein